MTTSKGAKGAGNKKSTPAKKSTPQNNEPEVQKEEVTQETETTPPVTEPTKEEIEKERAKEAEDAPVKEENAEPDNEEPVVADEPVSRNQGLVINTLNQYIDTMRPGCGISEEAGAREQTRLANVLINNVFSADKGDFQDAIKVVLDTVEKHRDGVFHEKYVFRFVASMRVASERRVLFEDLMTLITITADQGIEATTRQVDIRKLIDRLADERMIENLQTFYKLG